MSADAPEPAASDEGGVERPVPSDVIPSDVLPAPVYRDLPPPIPWKRMVGPSVILSGLALGSGEYVLWPSITAKYGFVLFWACLLGVITQYFINMEIERWALAGQRRRGSRINSREMTVIA